MLAAVVLWVFFGVVSAGIATARGRSGVGWFLLGILFGPFALAVALLPTAEATRQAQAHRRGPGVAEVPLLCGGRARGSRRMPVLSTRTPPAGGRRRRS
jgi:hypothetical protein